uniref:Astacin domain-containing protein n=1 Tax=Strongyloides papillosus TaxID=174720 RepID=A0A0N5BU74_STREA
MFLPIIKRVLFFLVIILSSSKQLVYYPSYPKYPEMIEYYVNCTDSGNLISSVFTSFNYPTSCLLFNRVYEPIQNKVGINFYEHGDETYVTLSNSTKMPTNVYFNKSIFLYSSNAFKKVALGVGLALGLIPEVERIDRDDNIEIYLDKISENYKKYYNKTRITNTSTDFDFTSTMLYDFHFGAEKGENAFKSKLYPYYEDMLKNIIVTISYNDKRRVNEIYCYNECKDKPPCENGGYYDKDCLNCNCPLEFKGATCNETFEKGCNSEEEKTYIVKPESGIEDLKLEHTKGNCIFLIKSDNNNSKIIIEIEKMNFSITAKPIKNPFIEIRYRNDKGTKGLVFYQNVSNITLPSLSEKVYIITNDDLGSFDLSIRYHANTTETKEIFV